MDDLIRRSDAIRSVLGITMLQGRVPMDTVIYRITSIPAVEPCKDAVDIEDCVDRYSVLAELDPRSYEYKAVKELPSVIPKPKEVEPKQGEWIPCSERLPRTSVDVLTYRPNMGMPMLVDRYDRYYGEDDNEYYEEWAYGGDNVIAWMELPKPWKGADDENLR